MMMTMTVVLAIMMNDDCRFVQVLGPQRPGLCVASRLKTLQCNCMREGAEGAEGRAVRPSGIRTFREMTGQSMCLNL